MQNRQKREHRIPLFSPSYAIVDGPLHLPTVAVAVAGAGGVAVAMPAMGAGGEAEAGFGAGGAGGGGRGEAFSSADVAVADAGAGWAGLGATVAGPVDCGWLGVVDVPGARAGADGADGCGFGSGAWGWTAAGTA